MPNITYAPVERYLYSILPDRPPVLLEIERRAKERNIPIVGPAVGRVLYQYATLIGARNVFEMGSAIGYSTIWWALAVGEGGRVVYTDSDPKNADEADDLFREAGVADRISVRVGDSLDLLAHDGVHYDILFNDVDKEAYPRVLAMAGKHVRKGGLFITDNVLWSGRVATKTKARDKSTQAIAEFNDQLKSSPEWFNTILPLRDGLAIAQRV